MVREYNKMKEEIKSSGTSVVYKKLWNFCGIYYRNMVDINRKTYERNGAGTIVDSDGILC